jgi:hypothetical protein
MHANSNKLAGRDNQSDLQEIAGTEPYRTVFLLGVKLSRMCEVKA